jgi:hypothetical protein
MGHVRVACNSCHDQLQQTVFYESPHNHGHRSIPDGDGIGSSALSASATTARVTAIAAGRSGAATQTTQTTSPAVCALTTLAFLPAAA